MNHNQVFKEIDMRLLYDDLTEAFVNYQYRLENPIPSPSESFDVIKLKYHTDSIFHAKVESLVAGVMHIVSKRIKATE